MKTRDEWIKELDEQVASLTEHPEAIEYEWGMERGLFSLVKDVTDDRSYANACLTMVKQGDNCGYPDLQALIEADPRIPGNPDAITIAHLPAFRELQIAVYDYFHPEGRT